MLGPAGIAVSDADFDIGATSSLTLKFLCAGKLNPRIIYSSQLLSKLDLSVSESFNKLDLLKARTLLDALAYGSNRPIRRLPRLA